MISGASPNKADRQRKLEEQRARINTGEKGSGAGTATRAQERKSKAQVLVGPDFGQLSEQRVAGGSAHGGGCVP